LGGLGVVGLKVLTEIGVDSVEGLVPGGTALHAEVLVDKGPVEALSESVGLGPADPGGAVLDSFELGEYLVGVLVGSATELAPVVGEHGPDLEAVLVEGGEDTIVRDVDGSPRELGGEEAGPDLTAEGTEDGLAVYLPDALQGADEEGVNGHEVAGEAGFDVTLPELGAVALKKSGLLLGQDEFPRLGGLLGPEKPFMLGEEVMAAPDAANAAEAYLHPAEEEVIGGAPGPMAWLRKTEGEDGFFDLRAESVGVQTRGAGEAAKQPLGAVGLEAPASAGLAEAGRDCRR
jgi:hypothetical protein